MISYKSNFSWKEFLQPYELAVEGFILKIEGIKKQYSLSGIHCPIEIVSGRIKTPESILDKAIRMGVDYNHIDEKVHDIGGIRITCKYVEDVYQVAELLKSRKDIEVVEIRDYIKNVKPSGYRSYHLISKYKVETINGQIPLLLEFQIRTHAMHFWASIEHSIKYKYKKNIPADLKARLRVASRAAEQLDIEMSSIHEALIQLEKSEINHSFQEDPLEREIVIHRKIS